MILRSMELYQYNIKKWINSLINQSIDYSIIDNSFNIEDGMILKEYIDYELLQFKNLSYKYDLDNDFKIKIYHIIQNNNKNKLYFYYVINKYNKIVCKMHITLNDENLITSNNSLLQVVPKFTISKNQKIGIGLAINSKYDLINVINKSLNIEILTKGNNYDNDKFNNVKFTYDSIEDKEIKFKFILRHDNRNYIEDKVIFFDNPDLNLKPYKIKDNKIIILNEMYPVHLTYVENNQIKNIEYPRDIILDFKNKKDLIVTDSLDNDWIINNE